MASARAGRCAVISSQSEQYHALARECLEMAVKANDEVVRIRLIELSRQWTDAALIEQRSARQPAKTSARGSDLGYKAHADARTSK
jgi:hypothetical protein